MDTEIQKNIQLLPEHIIDQIKAGEVIERPSTLLKEILENSIDAGSSKIDLHLIENGLELISIIDNGKGIEAGDLPLAFCRHATSKIDRFEDIYHLSSYGFRGEALASIASISKISCQSKTKSSSGLIKIEGGLTTLHEEVNEKNSENGTQIYIKDLFFNTPVRMKFVQSKTSEKNHITKIVRSFLISNPDIQFSLKWDQNEKEIFPPTDEETRIKDVLFSGKSISLTSSETTYDGVHFKVFLSEEASRGNAHKQHFLFINDRYVQDIQIHKIILNSAKGLWPEGETGHYVAKLYVPKDELDVNVHPNKTVIKLFAPAKVYSVISGTIKNKIAVQIPQKPITNDEQLSFSEKNYQDLQEREINYKQIDFSQTENVDHYLSHIHDQKTLYSNSHEQSQFFHFEKSSLYMNDDKVFFIEHQKLISTVLEDTFNKSNFDSEPLPLLVSRPIQLKRKVNENLLTKLSNFGFEFDFLDDNCLVIRSFPKELQHFPYLKIVEYIINQNTIDFDFSSISTEGYQSHTIEKLFSENSLLRTEIREKDLLKVYGKKK